MTGNHGLNGPQALAFTLNLNRMQEDYALAILHRVQVHVGDAAQRLS
ncbi:hypothetical protein D5125_17205 [Magnetovirga frankeli]|nr:hypothetical protein D5125_17205 [gamma proteobacterium SS-5]